MNTQIPKGISLSEVKLQLAQLGISTSTPDLEGEPRYLELLSRLQKYYDGATSKTSKIDCVDTSSTSNIMQPNNTNILAENIGTTHQNDDLKLESLSISDIKSKLALYGEVSCPHH